MYTTVIGSGTDTVVLYYIGKTTAPREKEEVRQTLKLALSPESSQGRGCGLQAMASTASKDANHHLVATLTSDSQVIQLRNGITLKVLQHVRLLDIHMGVEETQAQALTFTQFQDKLYLVTLSQSGNNLTTFRVSSQDDAGSKVLYLLKIFFSIFLRYSYLHNTTYI